MKQTVINAICSILIGWCGSHLLDNHPVLFVILVLAYCVNVLNLLVNKD